MLIIEPDDEVVLSPEYHALHNISVRLHDQMAYITKHEDYAWFQQAPEGITDDPIDALARDIIQALLVDFLHFIYESLSAAKKGKISVAYALLRKPLTDMLLLFEQILFNRHEFILRFTQQDPAKYDPSFANLNREAIVTQACDKLKLEALFDAEFVHDMRYDKTSTVGLAGSVHQALHIVTRNKYYPTPPAYFNFVFDSVESLNDYWQNYYHVVTYLLCYSAAVMDEIIFDFMPEHFSVKHLKNIQRFLFFLELGVDHEVPKTTPDQETVFEYLGVALAHNCQICGHDIGFRKADHVLFTQEMLMLCPVCAHNQFMDMEFDVKFHEAWARLVPM